MGFKTRDQRAQRWRIVRTLSYRHHRNYHLPDFMRRRVDRPGQGAQQEPPESRAVPVGTLEPLRRPQRSALRPRRGGIGRPAARQPADRPCRCPGCRRCDRQGAWPARRQGRQLRPRNRAVAGRRPAQAPGVAAALFRQVARGRAAPRRRRQLRLQACPRGDRRRRRARLQPAQRHVRRRARRPHRWSQARSAS